MKKYLLAVLLLASFQSFGQFLNYTNINGRYKWIAGKFDSTFTLPSGPTPSLRTGGGNAPGALFYSTTDSVVYEYTGSQWRPLHGSDTSKVQIAYVRNTSGSSMTTGQVVYINGSTGTTPTIALANNKNDSSSAVTFGIVRGNIANNAFGWITTFGPIEGINTNAYTEGESIYLDSISGQFTHDKPVAPYHMVVIGYVIKKAANGIVFAKIQNGYELDELHNVKITGPVLNKSVLVYDSIKALWVDSTVSAAGLGLGGSGTTNYVSKWTSSTALGNSQIFDNGTDVGINTSNPSAILGGLNGLALIKSTGAALSLGTTTSNYVINYYSAGNQFIWYSSGVGNSVGRMFNGTGNWQFGGGAADAGFKVDVQGTFRSTLDANINGLTVGKGGGSFSTNTAFGVSALAVNTTGGANNVAIGNNALALNTSAGENTALGSQAGNKITTGYRNTSIGYRSFNALTTGIENVSVGAYNAEDITTAKWNTIIGYNTGRGIITGDGNTIIGANVSGLSSSLSNTIILADGQGNQRLYINSSGNVGIGTTSPTTGKLQVLGGTYQGVFNSTTQAQIKIALSGTDGYDLVTTSTFFGIYNGFYGEYRLTLFNNGNLGVGVGTTDAGYKLDVNGTARVTSSTILESGSTFGKMDNTSSYPNLTARYASGSGFDVVGYSAGSQGGRFRWEGTTSINLQSTYFRIWNDNSGTTEYVRFDGSNQNVGIGTNTPNTSAKLDITSTTKGFLPPRMTGAQAEAISSPAVGLLVYCNNGNGTTITSTGWWGYETAGWVKLN